MMFEAHWDLSMFCKSYMFMMVTVNEQASFLEEPLHWDYHENLQGMSLCCNPQLWQTLSTKLKNDLKCSSEYVALDTKIEALTAKIKTVNSEDSEWDWAYQKTLYKKKCHLTLNSLQEWRKQQSHKAEQNMSSTDHYQICFSWVCHLMSEWDWLTINLFLLICLQSSEGQAVIHDLIALCKNNGWVTYHLNLQPFMSHCLSPQCAL